MKRNVLLNMLLSLLKIGLGSIPGGTPAPGGPTTPGQPAPGFDWQGLLWFTVILTNSGVPAKLTMGEDGVKVVYADGSEVPHDEPVAITFKL